ncbi:MAG: hypothetical protein V1808_00660 [Candidatus Daviesbacteria bacterium]
MKVYKERINPKVVDVLIILGMSALVISSIAIPALPMTAKIIIDLYKKKKHQDELREWRHFNQARLHQMLKKLYEQKVVEVVEEKEEISIRLSEKGKTKLLKYQLENMMIEKPPKWDGKWRVIIYDIPKEKRLISEIFRRFLKKIMFLKLQKSVYLTPYPCDKQIEFLRQYYNLSKEVLYLVVQRIENEEVYKQYFDI